MKLSLGYITAPSKAEAKRIVRKLLDKKLVACANILPSVESFYVWRKKVKEEKEAVIIIKTQETNEDEIIDTVKKMHSYECPCIVFLPLTNGSKEFMGWVGENC